MATIAEIIARLKASFYNSRPYAPDNLGGLVGRHDLTFPAALADVGAAAEQVGTLASQVSADAAQVALDRGAVASAAGTASAKAVEAVAARDAAASYAGQARGIVWVPASGVGGTANAITLAPTPPVTAYAAGLAVEFAIKSTSTGAVTVNISGLGGVALMAADGAALPAGALIAGALVRVLHDGTALRLVNGKAPDSALSATRFETTGVAPAYAWRETDAAVDSKGWDAVADGSVLRYRVVNDSLTSAVDWMTITRSGMVVSGVNFLALVTLTGGYLEYVAARAGTGAALTLTTANVQRYTHNANTTITLPPVALAATDCLTLTVDLLQDGTGGRAVTWAAPAGQTIEWFGGGTAPTITTTASRRNRFQFSRMGGETVWTAALTHKGA